MNPTLFLIAFLSASLVMWAWWSFAAWVLTEGKLPETSKRPFHRRLAEHASKGFEVAFCDARWFSLGLALLIAGIFALIF